MRISLFFLTVLTSLTLTACGGSSSSSGSSNSNDGPELSPVTGENALTLSRKATSGVGELPGTKDDIMAAFEALGELDADSPETQMAPLASAPSCDSGSLSVSGSGESTSFTANDCVYQGNTYNGTFVTSFGEWSDYPAPPNDISQEFIFAGQNPSFSSTGNINFTLQGGFGYRFASLMPDSPPTGSYRFAFEYGATSDGFQLEAAGTSLSFPPNLSVGWLIEFDVIQTGVDEYDVTNFSQSLTSGGTFELNEGEFYEISFDGIQTDDGDDVSDGSVDPDAFEPQFNDGFCPNAGTVTISGADGTQAQVFFGTDAPDGYEVQVTGPDGFTEEYATCADFYADN